MGFAVAARRVKCETMLAEMRWLFNIVLDSLPAPPMDRDIDLMDKATFY